MDELKPCPFCGSDAMFRHIFENQEKCMVGCRGCDVVIDAVFPNELEAAKEWNYQVLADEIAALRDEIDRLCAALKLAQARARDYEAEVERLRAAYEAPPTPLTLEELDAMDNEPVFIQTGDGQEFWFLADKEWPYELDLDPDFINMKTTLDPDGHFGLHVLGWQAFRRKPE